VLASYVRAVSGHDLLGILPGEVLDFDEDQGRLVASKARAREGIASVFGILDLGMSTDTLIDELRGEADAF
jgi:hypothetical protein